jgi:cytochrome P450
MTSHNAPVVRLKIASAAAVQDPTSVFRQLLSAGRIVFDPDLDAFVVGHFADVRDILKRADDFAQHAEFHEKMIGARDFLGMADPEHAEVRSAFAPSFVPRAVRELEVQTREIVTRVIDGCASDQGGVFDGIARIGRPVAGETLAAMLNIPTDDIAIFMRWAEDISRTIESLAEPDPERRLELEQAGADATKMLLEYAGALAHERRVGTGSDVVTRFITSEVGKSLPALEQQANIARIILGGFDNTWKLIGHMLVLFGQHQDQWHALRSDPDLIDPAIEEILRFVTSSPVIQRVATRDLEFAGVQIRRGTHVFLMLGAANRDPARWPDGDRFDITRNHHPHLEFGIGPHVCIGGFVTRMELRTLLVELAARLPEIRLADEQITYGPIFMARGPREVWLTA